MSISNPRTARSLSVAFAVSLIVSSFAAGQTQSHGPAKGYLLITGGATEAPDYQRLIELGGGSKASVVVVPNGSVTKPTTPPELQEEYCGPKSPFSALPGVPCTVIYTNDHAVRIPKLL